MLKSEGQSQEIMGQQKRSPIIAFFCSERVRVNLVRFSQAVYQSLSSMQLN